MTETITVLPEIETEDHFDVPGPHKMGKFDVFRGAMVPRVLGLIAVSPIFLFPGQLALFLTIGWPYRLLEVTIIAIPFTPVFAWLLAAKWHTTHVYVWRSFTGTAVLLKEPWRKVDLADLPAAAWHRVGDSQGLIPVIDCLDHEISDSGLNAGTINGHEFDPASFTPGGADDELVSMVLRTEAATKVYSARPVKDRFQNVKIGGMILLLGFGLFMMWLISSSMNKPDPV